MDQLFFSFMTALLIGMALIPPLRLVAERFSVMDLPGDRKVHQHPVPRIGVVAIAIGACATIAWSSVSSVTLRNSKFARNSTKFETVDSLNRKGFPSGPSLSRSAMCCTSLAMDSRNTC